MSWYVKLNTMTWVSPPEGNQNVSVSYRQGGTSGAFTAAGTIIFKPDGTISGMPNPFVIAELDDSWSSIEVKSVNTCNGIEVSKTFNKP